MTIYSTKMRGQRGGGIACAKSCGFTLAEVMVAFGISVMFIGGMIYGYVGTARRAEWSGYSLAAQSLAQQGIEQARLCKWDLANAVPTDELVSSNFPKQINMLDLPIMRTGSYSNAVWATNIFTITTVQSNPPIKCIRVDCFWPWVNGRASRVFSNSVITYRTADVL